MHIKLHHHKSMAYEGPNQWELDSWYYVGQSFLLQSDRWNWTQSISLWHTLYGLRGLSMDFCQFMKLWANTQICEFI